MQVSIREAGLEDIELLMEWRIRALCEVFGVLPDALNAIVPQCRRYYLEEIPAGGHIACFAVCGETVVGCGGICLYREMPSPENPNGRCGYLMNIYTQPEYRSRGIGRMTVRWLIDRARENGVSKIFLETSQQGEALYRALGFTDMSGYLQLFP